MRARHLLRLAGFTLAFVVVACGGRTPLPVDTPEVGPTCNPATEPPQCASGTPIATSKLHTKRVDKIDLLLMIDNSASMDDKQAELANRIPSLITKLTDQTPDAITGLPRGIGDLHVGVITSSLGSFGTSACDPAVSAHNDDHGYLLPRAGEGPFGKAAAAAPLAWVFNPKDGSSDPYIGAAGAVALASDTTSVVTSAKADGCGYESQLEAIYHFLIDPAPYAKASVSCRPSAGGDSCLDPTTGRPNLLVRSGVDAEILRERAAFLRTDSLVAVIMLTDENDNSLRPIGTDWVPWAYAPGTMAHGWSACANVPDDVEPDDNSTLFKTYGCKSCFADPKDPACTLSWPTTKKDTDIDGNNTRENRQVQRYGYNFLWSRDRYVAGFTQASVRGSDDKLGPNPLFAGGFRTRDLVLFAAITGVPEDLVANPDHSAKSLSDADWDRIVSTDYKVRDYRMIESIGVPRTMYGGAMYVGGGDLSASPIGGSPTNPIYNGNGGERHISGGDDLQYACIQERSATPTNNDCNDAMTAGDNPLCVKKADGSYRQAYYKAYPGLRQLRVARALGPSGFVASICAKSYEPAVDGILAKINAEVAATCIALPASPDASGSEPCVVAEVFPGSRGPHGETSCEKINAGSTGYCTPGSAPCRVAGSAFPPIAPTDVVAGLTLDITVRRSDGTSVTEAVTPIVGSDGNVYAVSKTDGVKHLVCEEAQLTGADGTACRNDPSFTPVAGGGWCYSQNGTVVGESCTKLGVTGTVRFTGTTKPGPNSEVFSVCKLTCCGM